MKNQWMAHVIVALLAVGAGVAIAGLPNNVPVDATITAPTTEPTGTTADTTASTPPPTTEAASTTQAPVTTDVPETTAPSDTTVPPTSEPDVTEPDVTEPTEPDAVPDRADIVVAVANGNGVAGSAARNVAFLDELGYEILTQHDGTEVADFTVIYFAPGSEAAAARMAQEYDLLPVFIAPLADAPAVFDLPAATELLAYIGADRA
jgi:cytoskeletal protein RodZ